MFNINDFVVYNLMGVYRIVDIRKEKDINDKETEYYILQPAYNNNLTIKIPVGNPNIFMREIIKKEDALSLIAAMPETETIWIDNAKQRGENFREALKTGDSEEWVKLIKTIYIEKQEKLANGKKMMKADEEIMKAAEKNLYEEFAVALDITPDKVVSYIQEHVS